MVGDGDLMTTLGGVAIVVGDEHAPAELRMRGRAAARVASHS